LGAATTVVNWAAAGDAIIRIIAPSAKVCRSSLKRPPRLSLEGAYGMPRRGGRREHPIPLAAPWKQHSPSQTGLSFVPLVPLRILHFRPHDRCPPPTRNAIRHGLRCFGVRDCSMPLRSQPSTV
jgi:hypothetical protein